MSGLFARVVKQAFITFDQSNANKFKANFNALKLLVDQLTAVDLNIDPELMKASYFDSCNKAPVTYMEILENETFIMSVFIVRNKYTMPLHDHPGFGLLRVLSGTAKIQSYSLMNGAPMENLGQPNILSVIKEPVREVHTKTESAVLTPTICNIHEITGVSGDPVAFFDILSPPYESKLSVYGPKKCSFYRPIQSKSNSNESTISCDNLEMARMNVHLQTCGTPPHYYCDSVHYYPPDFLRDYCAH